MATFVNLTDDYLEDFTNFTNMSTSSAMDAIGNVTSPADADDDVLSLLVMAAVALLGFVAVVLNAAILLVVVKGDLVRKDYRIIYYAFITLADFLYGVHTVFLTATLVFRQVQFFKEMPVCLIIQGTGLTSYFSSAGCILLLVVDLIRGIIDPHAGTLQRKKLVAVVTCCCTWVVGGLLTYGPFSTWYDPSRTLEFCSIANVYGPHFSDYNFIAVCTLSTLFLLMALLSGGLLYQIKAMQMKSTKRKAELAGQSKEGTEKTNTVGKAVGSEGKEKTDTVTKVLKSPTLQRDCDNDTTDRGQCKEDVSVDKRKPGRQLSGKYSSETSINTQASAETNTSYLTDQAAKDSETSEADSNKDGVDKDEAMMPTDREAETSGKEEPGEERQIDSDKQMMAGNVNAAKLVWKRMSFTAQKQRSEEKIYKVTGTVSAVKDPQTANLKEKQNEQQRKKYLKACKTVGLFIAAYVGCLMPYYIVMVEGLFCSTDCDTDHPTRRTIRLLCALALYCLPVVNPILYTSRFAIFRKASVHMLSDNCCFCRKN